MGGEGWRWLILGLTLLPGTLSRVFAPSSRPWGIPTPQITEAPANRGKIGSYMEAGLRS